MKFIYDVFGSFPVVFILFYLYPPATTIIALLILYFKMSYKYGRYLGLGYFLRNIAFIWGSIGLFVLLFSNGEQDLTGVYALNIVPSLILLVLGYLRILKLKKYDHYITYLGARRTVNIFDLCDTLNTDKETVIKNIEFLLQKKVIDGYIEHDHIYIQNGIEELQEVKEAEELKVKQTEILVPVKCTGCGAVTKVAKNSEAECEYCGTILKA